MIKQAMRIFLIGIMVLVTVPFLPGQETDPVEETDLAAWLLNSPPNLFNDCGKLLDAYPKKWPGLVRPHLLGVLPVDKQNDASRQPTACLIWAVCQYGNQVFDEVRTWLTDPEANIRLAAVKALGLTSGRTSILVPLLLERLNDADADVRHAAGRALGCQRDEAAIRKCLDSADMRQRLGGFNALTVLSLLDYKASLVSEYYPQILATWRAAVADSRREIAAAIHRLRVPAICLPDLKKALAAAVPAERLLAVCGLKELLRILGTLENQRNQAFIVNLAKEPFWINVSYTAEYWEEYDRKVKALVRQPLYREVYALLGRALLDPADEVSAEAFDFNLWREKSPDYDASAWRELQSVLRRSPNANIRRTAVDELNSELDDHPAEVAPILAAYLCDPDVQIANKVDFDDLKTITPIISGLAKAMADSRPEIRMNVFDLISEQLTEKHSGIVQALRPHVQALLNNHDPGVRWLPACFLINNGASKSVMIGIIGNALPRLTESEQKKCLSYIEDILESLGADACHSLAKTIKGQTPFIKNKLIRLMVNEIDNRLTRQEILDVTAVIFENTGLTEIEAEVINDMFSLFDWENDQPILQKMLQHRSVQMRLFILQGLIRNENNLDNREKAVAAVKHLLQDRDAAVRQAAKMALEQLQE